MASKVYAVKKGRNPGIYNTWTDCQKEIMGFSGAVYKSFTNRKDAELFISGEVEKKDPNRVADVVAYVDGSYDNSVQAFSYGMVIFDGEQELRFSEKFEHHPFADMRNVAGEIFGAQKAMEYCIQYNKKQLDLYYDYEGISRWCTGEWKANKEGTKRYKQFYDAIKQHVDVNFIKVKGHSGDRYNDLADQLAKDALFGNKGPSQVSVQIELPKQEGNEVQVSEEQQLFTKLKGAKTGINLGILSGQAMITEKELLAVVKEKWKQQKRLQKEIREMKGYFDLNNSQFVVGVETINGEWITIELSLEEVASLI